MLGLGLGRVGVSGRLSGRPCTCLAIILIASACAVRLPDPVTLPQPDARPALHLDQIYDYQGAAVAIAAVLERELGVAPFPVTVHFYPDTAAFEAALVKFGQDPDMARDTAEAMRAVGMRGRVLLTNDMLEPLPWRDRVRVLTHELIHALQYELTGGLRGTSEQWLREGFAEWVSLMVLDRLRGPELRVLRAQQLTLFNRSDRARAPRLDEMVNFEQWIGVVNRRGIAPYSQAFLTVDFLVERHGAPTIVEYLRQFASTRDRRAAFRRVFGEEPAAFEAAVDEWLGIRRRAIPDP